eukprot:Pompholyxophrys_punicea_v1_NODE_95_length_3532_cov_6.599080.p3 type:complete len:129 gc:universal NODE_95_length_3532_cov_6.599080:2771-3157(+)
MFYHPNAASCCIGGKIQKEQAGFRSKCGTIEQVATLFEVLQRRKMQGMNTYLAFIDMKKAFDMTSHNGLIQKLRAMGIKGRALDFIIALYKSGKLVARGNGGTKSETFPLKRGVRQGCNLSPFSLTSL